MFSEQLIDIAKKNLPEAKLYSCKTSDVQKIVDYTVQSRERVSFLNEKKLNIFSIIDKHSLLVEKRKVSFDSFVFADEQKKQLIKEMCEKEEQGFLSLFSVVCAVENSPIFVVSINEKNSIKAYRKDNLLAIGSFSDYREFRESALSFTRSFLNVF